MKIAVNTRFLLKDNLEGIGRYTNELIFRIVAAHPECEFHFIFDRPYHSDYVSYENIIPHVVSPPLRHPLLGWIWFDWSVKRILRKIQADVFFSPDGMNMLSPECKTVTVLHDLNFEHFPEYFGHFLLSYYKKRSPVVANNSKFIVTVSEFSAEDISRTYGIDRQKIKCIHNAADAQFVPVSDGMKSEIRLKYTDGKPYFLFVGGLYHRKNLLNLLLAFEQFKVESNSDIKLMIAGQQVKDAKQLIEKVKVSKFKSDVILTGRLKDDDLPKVMASAMALTYVSSFEGFGMPMLEAMKCGIPIITSSTTSMPEVAGDAALYAQPFDINEICERMIEMSSKEELRKDLSKKALVQASKFDWDKSAEELWDVLYEAATS